MAWPPAGKFSFKHSWFGDLTQQLWTKYLLPRFESVSTPINYIETGVSEGASLIWAMEHLSRPGGLFVGIDPFIDSRHWHEGEGDGHKEQAITNISIAYGGRPVFFTNGLHQWHERESEGMSVIALHTVPSQQHLLIERRRFHVGYVDGHHDAHNCLLDMMLIFELLVDHEGILIVDDYDRRFRAGRPQVKEACDAFEQVYAGHFDVLYVHQKQVAYVKQRPRRRKGYGPVLEQGPIISERAS